MALSKRTRGCSSYLDEILNSIDQCLLVWSKESEIVFTELTRVNEISENISKLYLISNSFKDVVKSILASKRGVVVSLINCIQSV